MRATIIHAPGDIRVEEVPDPEIRHPTDAIIRTEATCVCGTDLWSYRGIHPVAAPQPIGHEYIGVVEEVGSEVATLRPGQFVIGSFVASDNECEHCRGGYHSACRRRELVTGCQAELVRIPLADGTLVALPEQPGRELYPGLLAVSDVMGTGWYAAVAAEVRPGAVVAVVGDGAVGLCGVIAAKELGAQRIIVMSRNPERQRLALGFGATDLVAERGAAGIAAVRELTAGSGAGSVLECVGTGESLQQALGIVRPGGNIGFVGLPAGVDISGRQLFHSHAGVRGGMAPVRRFLPDLIDRVLGGIIDPGLVFDLVTPLDNVAEAYRAMDARQATKVYLQP
ncbi:zinc-binding dehydrogenase [Nocardia sp. NPDC127579]|uniref:zinc-binding dehydrogenase n=1 Tax=Nocardia sp. NPDC127579 TaxID=3345402 RepID=UPI0036434B3F